MREIKFRIYDTGRNEWVHGPGHEINLLGECVICGEILRRPDDSLVSLYDLNNLVVLRYTGLKDKHGEEIYEGDLVAEIDKFDELEGWGCPLVVEFGDYREGPDSWGLMFSTRGFFLRYQDGSVTGIHNCESSYGFTGDKLMKIGNIYQHPHLLKQ